MRSRLLDPCSIIRVQSWDVAASAPSAINQLVDATWPRDVGTVASGLVDVLCVSPTEWLIVGADPNSGLLHEKLVSALLEAPLRAIDISQGFACLGFEGPDAREFLLKGCSLDLHPDRFPATRCARTRFAGVPVVLRCRSDAEFEAIVPASYTNYLLAWIADASTVASTINK
jgi:sarcosine oxidase, subunit gamma